MLREYVPLPGIPFTRSQLVRWWNVRTQLCDAHKSNGRVAQSRLRCEVSVTYMHGLGCVTMGLSQGWGQHAQHSAVWHLKLINDHSRMQPSPHPVAATSPYTLTLVHRKSGATEQASPKEGRHISSSTRGAV